METKVNDVRFHIIKNETDLDKFENRENKNVNDIPIYSPAYIEDEFEQCTFLYCITYLIRNYSLWGKSSFTGDETNSVYNLAYAFLKLLTKQSLSDEEKGTISNFFYGFEDLGGAVSRPLFKFIGGVNYTNDYVLPKNETWSIYNIVIGNEIDINMVINSFNSIRCYVHKFNALNLESMRILKTGDKNTETVENIMTTLYYAIHDYMYNSGGGAKESKWIYR